MAFLPLQKEQKRKEIGHHSFRLKFETSSQFLTDRPHPVTRTSEKFLVSRSVLK